MGNQPPIDGRDSQRRQAAGQFADGLDAQLAQAQDADDARRRDHGNGRPGEPRVPALQDHDEQRRPQTEAQADPVYFAGVGDDAGEGVPEARRGGDVQAHQVPQLVAQDQDAGAGGEPDDHRVGDEIDQHPQAGQPRGQPDDAGHDRQQAGGHQVFGRARHGHGNEHGEHEHGGGIAGAGLQLVGRAPECADDGADDGGIEAHLGRQLGDEGVGDSLRQGDHGDGQAGDQVGAQVGDVVFSEDLDGPDEERGDAPQAGQDFLFDTDAGLRPHLLSGASRCGVCHERVAFSLLDAAEGIIAQSGWGEELGEGASGDRGRTGK